MNRFIKHLKTIFFSFWIIVFAACSQKYLPKTHVLPQPEDTFSKDITYQNKTDYKIDGINADNLFDGARLNDFIKVDDSTYRAIILPENTPINESSYYAFKIWSDVPQDVNIELYYPDHVHRYWPKLSYDKVRWFLADSSRFDTLKAGNIANLKLFLNAQELFVSAQEIKDSEHTRQWCQHLAESSEQINHQIIGKSKLNRDLHCLDIYDSSKEDKDCIVIFSRLHPPEVSGFLAMEHFVEALLEDNVISNSFRKKYRVLVYPLINPDGVDLGHWRHSAGGIDLNRDWAYYRQEESRVVAQHLVKAAKKSKNKVILGLDFHSTQEDLYYTLTDNRKSSIYNFKDLWFHSIDLAFDNYTPDEQAYDLNQPITKAWFYLEFGAEGITYEVGDETPRDFVKEKARIASYEMMKLLVLKK